MHRPRPACMRIIYRKGARLLHISIKNHDTHTETGKYKALTVHGNQHDRPRSHKSAL